MKSNSAVLRNRPSSSVPSPNAVRVTRTPLYFESRQHWLFAWLHYPEHAQTFDHGILICPPIGHEQLHAHRSLRHLADALASAGFPVLRFDYHGTGDSSGSDEDPERVATWLANVRDARRWLTEQLGCTRTSAIGLRLGAALAAQAAAEQPMENLLLWAPVAKARAYVREMKALSLTMAGNAGSSEDMEAAGFVLTEQTLQDLNPLDLLQIHPLCRRALILLRDDAPADSRLLGHFQSLGIETQQTAQPGYADMMVDPLTGKVPWQTIAHVVDWLRARIADHEQHLQTVDANHAGQTFAPISHGSPTGESVFSQQQIRERVLAICQQPNLFGIVSEPADAASEALPFIVMLNTGATYRVGPHRLYVALSRQLAARGFRCLRMDLCGLGDSITPDRERENDPYPATAFRDIARTLECLETQFGARRVVLMGLCSGAYAAFQAAAQLSSALLTESVLINPVTFHWGPDRPLAWNRSPAVRIQTIQHQLTAVWDSRKWLKLLSGRSTLGILGAVKVLVERWKLKLRAGQAVPPCGAAEATGEPSHPVQEDLPGDLQRIAEAGRHLAFFFADADPGYDTLTFYARRKVEELREAGRMDVQFIRGGDHSFTRRAPRSLLMQAITEHLCRRYLETT